MMKSLRKTSRKVVALAILGGSVAGCSWLTPDSAPPGSSLSQLPVHAIDTYYDQGKRHFQSGQFGLALRRFEMSLAREGESVEVLNAIAAAYDRLDRFGVAKRVYQRALALDPGNAQTLNNLAYSMHLQGQHGDALQYLNLALNASDADRDVIFANLRRVQVALGEPRQQEREVGPWIERTGIARYTLVTSPPEDIVQIASSTDSDPSIIHVASAPSLRPVPVAAVTTVRLSSLSAQSVEPPGKGNVRIEFSNGVGRNGMAARLRDFFTAKSYSVSRLTNSKPFRQAESVIFYRPGYRAEAARLAETLPRAVRLERTSELALDIKLLIGRDLLHFDDKLMI